MTKSGKVQWDIFLSWYSVGFAENQPCPSTCIRVLKLIADWSEIICFLAARVFKLQVVEEIKLQYSLIIINCNCQAIINLSFFFPSPGVVLLRNYGGN